MELPWRDACSLLMLLVQWTCVQAKSSLPQLHTTRHARQRHSRVLTVVTKLDQPYMQLKKDSPFLMGNDRFEGYLVDLIQRLAEAMGFQYRLQLVNDGQYGRPGDNGTWTGIVGQIRRREADIGLGPMIITRNRTKVVEYSTPFMSFRSTALLRKPRRRKSRIKTLQELVSKWDIRKGVLTDGAVEDYLKTTRDPVYARMWALMTNTYPSVFVSSIQEGVHRARVENYAFILDSPKADFIKVQRPCDLYTTQEFLDSKHYALVLRKGGRLKSAIDAEIQRMKRNGQLDLMYLRWWRSQCNGRRVTKARNAKGTKKKETGYRGVTESVSRVTAIAIINGERAAIRDGAASVNTASLILLTLLVSIHSALDMM